MRNMEVKRLSGVVLATCMSLSAFGCSATKNTEVSVAEKTQDETCQADDALKVSQTEKTESKDEEKTTEAEESLGKTAVSETVSPEETAESISQEDLSSQEEMSDSDTDYELIELEEMDSDELTTTQKNAINMLNYMTVLTQEINDSKQSRIFLDNAYNSLINNTYPNAVDSKTQTQITSMLDTLHQYQMLSVKRERLEYIYEQNQAQALRQAIPNPVGLLSAVESGSILKSAVSVLYMAVDSVTSYKSSSSQADLEYLKDGWELDDAEAEEVHNSRTTAFNYMLRMVNDNDLPGDYALTEDKVEDFVTWKNKTNLVSKISWFESNQETYKEFGSYWLELAKDYYDSEDYQNCLEAFEKYEEVTTRIFRKDTDYADALPMAIVSAKEVMSQSEYDAYADKYLQVIMKNTEEWSTRYFVAQVYLDLYNDTKDKDYLDAAYNIVYDNVNELIYEQKELNETYLADIQKIKADEGATKQQKADVKQYNKMLEANRKVELAPVNEALYLNCDMLFALIEERGISSEEQDKIEAILHENGENIFLTTALDNRFRFEGSKIAFDADALEFKFTGEELSIPASCVTARSAVSVVISGESETTVIDDWTVKSVKRPKNSTAVSEFTVTYTSETAEKYKYTDGDSVSIYIVPIAEAADEVITFKCKAVKEKKIPTVDWPVIGSFIKTIGENFLTDIKFESE